MWKTEGYPKGKGCGKSNALHEAITPLKGQLLTGSQTVSPEVSLNPLESVVIGCNQLESA